MPNWNYNSVSIDAPRDAVIAWLIPWQEPNAYHFNMHLLFPEKFAQGDEKGDLAWSDDWFVDNTGSKWTPEVFFCEPGPWVGVVGGTVLGYDTAWSPNNGTLQRLHEKTGWSITNEYMEEGMQMHGRFTCENDECEDEELEYLTHCEICEEGKADHEFDEEQDGLICDDCRRKALPRRCNPRPQLFTDMQYASMIKNGIAARAGGDSGVYPVVKLFTPDAAASWLLSEASRDDPSIAFGLCDLGLWQPELGSVSLAELAALRGKLWLPVERDLHFTANKTLAEYTEEARRLWRINA